MSQRPWFPFYPGAYRADTAHLTAEEHGCYLLLLCHAWTHDGLIPEAESRRAAICNLHTNRFKKVWETLGGYWNKTGGGFSNPRLSKELTQAIELSEKRAKSGKRGGEANAKAIATTRARDVTLTLTEATNVASSSAPSAIATGACEPARRKNGGAGPPVPPVPYQEIQDGYNDVAYRAGLPQIVKLTDTRRRAMAARWHDLPDLEEWGFFWENVEGSPFLRGDGNRGWRATFDWLMKQSNFIKVAEGTYAEEKR